MPLKHPYIHEAEKGVFLQAIDDGADVVPATKKAKINIITARDIKRRADKIVIYNDQHNLPPPSLHDWTIIQPKAGRRPVLS